MSLTTNVTITSGGTSSTAIALGSTLPAGVFIPSAWTTADITFQASPDGNNWYNVYDSSGAQIIISAPSTSTFYAIDYTSFTGLPFIRLVSSASQAADRVLTIALRDIG